MSRNPPTSIPRIAAATANPKETYPSESKSWAIRLAVAASVSLAVLAAAAVVWSRRKSPADGAEPPPIVDGSVEANGGFSTATESRFHQCAERVRGMKLTPEERLLLYGWYKQALLGDAPPRPPSGIAGAWSIGVERAKWNAWDRCRGAVSGLAMQRYVQVVQLFEGAEKLSVAPSSDDESDGGPPSTDNLYAPRVSKPLHEEEESDDEGKDEGDASLDSPHRQWHKHVRSAASSNDTPTLRRLLASSRDDGDANRINVADSSGQTALHLASDRGSYECVQLLLEEGADVHAADHDGISVLQAAVIAGHSNVCRMLLERGADPDRPDADGDTPRSCAEDDGSPELRQLFSSSAPPPE